MGVNDLADTAANHFSDQAGNQCQLANLRANEAKHRKVCLRLAALEAGIREGTPEIPRVAADIVTAERRNGEKRRWMATALAESRIKKAVASTGHNMVFIPLEDNKPLCKKCQRCVHKGQTVPDQCTSCGKHRGAWRCLKCLLYSRSQLDKFREQP